MEKIVHLYTRMKFVLNGEFFAQEDSGVVDTQKNKIKKTKDSGILI